MYLKSFIGQIRPKLCPKISKMKEIVARHDIDVAIGLSFPYGLVVRIPPSHGGGRGSIPRVWELFLIHFNKKNN